MTESNANSRLEAFCDGVFAIAITLLVIDIKLPTSLEISDNSRFWYALKHILPSIAAFILSFTIILITWVNHHAGLKLTRGSSPAFIYANGLLLLTVAFLPFPTSLLGEYILTDTASPAVILFNFVIAIQALSWFLISRAALRGNLPKNEFALMQTRKNGMYAVYAFILYSTLAIAAIWIPLVIGIFTTVTWIFWLIHGITLREG